VPLPSRRPNERSRSLVASAYRVGDKDSDYARRSKLPWQKHALEVVRVVPELGYASRFYSRMLKQLRIYPAMRNAQDQKEEIKTGLPVDILNRIQDPGGGRSQILSSYGRLMCITGEGVLFGRDLETERERWSFVWNDEVKIETDSRGEPTKIIHKLGRSGETREYSPEQAVCYRLWSPSPENSYEAESPLQANLEIAEELIILTKSVRATAVSRLINGLLFMPSEISPPPEEPLGEEDPYNDPWSADFLEHVVTQIETPGTAEAAAPLISWVAGEWIDKIKWISVHDPQTDYMERDLRKEAIERLAYGMDMPPEALMGLGNSNHWAAMQILGDMWKSHGAPVAQQFCDELGAAYLQPALRDAGYPDWADVVVDFDASQVVVKADRSDDADSAAKLAMISPRGYRILKNIPEEYAPSDEERKQILEALGRGQQPREQSQPQRDPAEDGPPLPGPEGDSGRRTRVVTSSAASFEAMGAAMMALSRCRELAGYRLWLKQKHCPECFEQADGQPHALVASIVGPETVERLGLGPRRLVQGGTDSFKDMLVYWDYSPKQASAICELIETFAARTLYDERLPQLPSGFAAHLDRAKGMDNALDGEKAW
jgi:hypothetical protein